MSDIRTAAQALRDSVAALPEGQRGAWDVPLHDLDAVESDDRPAFSLIDYHDDQGRAAAHIARTASPDVVRAIAEHLLTIAEHDVNGGHDCMDSLGCAHAIRASAQTLAAAILRDQP